MNNEMIANDEFLNKGYLKTIKTIKCLSKDEKFDANQMIKHFEPMIRFEYSGVSLQDVSISYLRQMFLSVMAINLEFCEYLLQEKEK